MTDSYTNDVYLSLGSNVEPERHLSAAVALLDRFGAVLRISSVYETKPVGTPDQPVFLNAAVKLLTDLTLAEFQDKAVTWIENVLGRRRGEDPNAPRTIDIDVTLFNADAGMLAGRKIPDPKLLRHAFVAVPLAEIAPELIHPETGETMSRIARSMDSEHTIIGKRTDLSLDPPGRRPIDDTETGERSELIGCEGIETAIRAILRSVGEDPDREGLIGTPDRIRRMYAELTRGYRMDPTVLINEALFEVDYDELVIVKDIDYYSLCEHHLLPFFGQAHVGYLPRGKVLGLSKIPRIVEMYARRLQIQERMTRQIADFISETINPLGVAVVVEGVHMCSMMRGVKKDNVKMVTSSMLGGFRKSAKTRSEFMSLLGRPVAKE